MSEPGRLPAGTGVVPLEQIRALSGLEFLGAIAAGRLPAPPIGAVLGFRLVEVAHGRAVFEGAPQRAFYNPLGSVHGGWAMTLLNSCTACAVHSTLAAGQGYTSVETKVNFTRPLERGLRAAARGRPGDQRRPPHRHRRGPAARRGRPDLRPRHQHLPDLSSLRRGGDRRRG